MNIDPPYNTGKDFIYEDNFAEETGEFLRRDGQYDEQGNRLTSNFDSNGRFHTDWLNMIYPRLRVARDLLSDDGVIFISIDDGELHNLRKICDEIFGAGNFIANILWQKRTSPDARKVISNGHEHILLYAKNSMAIDGTLNYLSLEESDSSGYQNPDNDPRGPWRSTDFGAQGYRPNQMYKITSPSGREHYPSEGRCWKNVEEVYLKLLEDNRMWFGVDGNGVPRKKVFLSEKEGKPIWTWWTNSEVGHTQEATQALTTLLGSKTIFDYSKPVRLIKRMVELASKDDDIILDFFSGSATTAHAVMQLNTEDDGNRKYIMVQLPESTDNNLEACKFLDKIDKSHTICEIGKERIRRAGAKIKEEAGLTAQNLDIGFRVLKLDSSNMKEVYYTPEEYSQMGFNLEGFMDNIKPDRSDEDLLFQVMLDLGIPLSAKIEQDGKIFRVNENYLIACFDRVDTSMITEIAQKQPYYAVFRDSSFVNDSALVNVEQIFNTYSPSTIRRVL